MWNTGSRQLVPAGVRPPVQRPPTVVPSKDTGRYVVTSTGDDKEEFVIQTLCGEFQEKAQNHGRPTYQKCAATAGAAAPEVFLYYWDSRDGPSFEGWWFGKSVGGNEVWSHNQSKALKPPSKGWKIPFAGPVRNTFTVAPKEQALRATFSAAASETLKKLNEEAATTAAEAMTTVEHARATLGDGASMEALDSADQMLLPLPANIVKVQKQLEPLQSTAGSLIGEVRTNLQKLRQALTTVNQELQKIKIARPKVLQKQKQQEAEAKEVASLDEILQDATDKANAAEDMVEKTVIHYDMVEAAADDLTEAQKAVEQTQELASSSQLKIKEALAIIGRKMVNVKTFQSEAVREKANNDLNSLRIKLRDANQKLTPLLNVKQEFQQRAVAKRIVQEVNDRLAPAELDVDRAVEAAEPLSQTGSWPSKAIMKQAETAINVAADKLQAAMKFLEIKLKPATGLIKKELEKVEARGRAAEKRLTELRNQHRTFHEKEQSDNLVNDVQEKMKAVSEAVRKLEEVLGPYMLGVEADGDQTTSIQAADEAMKTANKATSAARIVISMRLVEVKRFTAAAGQEAQRSLQEYQKALEAAMKRVNDLKSAMNERKQALQRAEAISQVEAVEALAAKVTENGAKIQDEAALADMPWDQIRAAGDACRSGYVEAQEVIKTAQNLLTTRQIEAKNSDDAEESAELARLQQRLRSATGKISQFKTLPPAVEKQIALKKQIDEAVSKVTAAEEKVDQAIAAIEGPANDNSGEAAAADGKGAGKSKTNQSAASSVNGALAALKGVLRYLDVQAKTKKVPEEEITKLQERVNASQERVETAQRTMRESSEKATAKTLVSEVEQQVKAAEAAVEKFCEVMAPQLAEDGADGKDGKAEDSKEGGEAGDVEMEDSEKAEKKGEKAENKDKDIAAACRAAEQAAAKAIGGSKTIIAVKKVAAKRLVESVAKLATEELDALLARTEAAGQKMAGVKKEATDKKYAKAKAEVTEKFTAAEELVKMAVSIAEGLAADASKGEEGAEVDAAVERGIKAQQDAQASISSVRSTLQNLLRDMKAGESNVQSEFSQILVKVGPLQADLDKQKKTMSEREQKFVASRLLKEAATMFEKLDAKIEKATSAAAPLVGDNKEDFTGAMFVSRCVEALRAYGKKASKTKEAIFDEIRGDKSAINEAKFVEFMKALPELKAQDGAPIGEKELKAAYARMDSVGGGQVAIRQFEDQFRNRLVCKQVVALTDTISVNDSKVIRKLDLHEVCEGLEESAKDETTGLLRLKVRAEKDGKEGFVTLKGNQGTSYLEPFSAYEACLGQIDVGMQELNEAVNETMAYLKSKADDLSKKSALGPLGEAKAELMKMRVRASKAQTAHGNLKKQVAEAQKGHAEQLEAEKKRKEEAAEKARASAMLDEATELTDAAVADAEKACTAAETLSSATAPASDDGNPLQAMDEAARTLGVADLAVNKALDKIMKENMNQIRKIEKGPFVEVRRLMFRLKVKLAPLADRCKKAASGLQAAKEKVAGDAQRAVAAALRSSAQAAGLTADALFTKLSQGASTVPASALRTHLETLEGDARLKASELDLGLHHYAAGITRLGLLAMLQEYQRCVKDIAFTTDFQVKTSSTLRKLDKGELLEVLGQHGTDETVGLERVKCRAVLDLAEGWVTLKGNRGTAFLEPAAKPYMILSEAPAGACLQQKMESGSDQVGPLEAGEVLEVLEGPRREPPLEVVRVRGKAKKDGKTGWVTLKDPSHSEPSFELCKLMICKGSIALTTAFDIAECNAVRKLEVGEHLEQLEAPKEDEARKVTRVHVKCMTDGKEGWATMKGNQGTLYIAESQLHHTCRRTIPMESAFASGSKAVRDMEVGEILEVVEGPSTETKEGSMRARGRSLRSGQEGWFTVSKAMLSWSPRYTCKKATELRDGPDAASAKVLRKIDEGESLEVLEAPAAVSDASEAEGVLRLRLRADKDGAVGYAEDRAAKGEVFLKPVIESQ